MRSLALLAVAAVLVAAPSASRADAPGYEPPSPHGWHGGYRHRHAHHRHYGRHHGYGVAASYGREPAYFPGAGGGSPNALFGFDGTSGFGRPVKVVEYREEPLGIGVIYNKPPAFSSYRGGVVRANY